MINYDEIGLRIYMARRRRRLSQEQLAEALGVYQADISNLEKNKKGSGITDLSRLEQIAEYFDMPLTQLLFGTSETDMSLTGKGGFEMTKEEMIARYKQLLAAESLLKTAGFDEEEEAYADRLNDEIDRLVIGMDLEDYARWKEEYVEAEYQKLKDRKHLITVRYTNRDGDICFYTVAQDQVRSVLNMIEDRGMCNFVGLGNATEDELRLFIAQNADDEEFRDAHFE